jgi:hypothetical protein
VATASLTASLFFVFGKPITTTHHALPLSSIGCERRLDDNVVDVNRAVAGWR